MIGNYIILAISCFGIFIALFKIKNEIGFRLLVIIACLTGILATIAKIMSLPEDIIIYPLITLIIVFFLISTYKVWKIRKVPEKKAAAYFYLIIMSSTVVFGVVMYILIESGVFD